MASPTRRSVDRSTQRFVEQLKNIHAGPIRELQAEHEKLAKLVTSNAITEDEANTGKLRAQQRYQDALRKSREEQQKLSGSRSGKDQADAGGAPTRRLTNRARRMMAREERRSAWQSGQ